MITEFTRFAIFLAPVDGKQTPEELIRRHVAFLRKLDGEGRLVLCGPFTDRKGGMIILKADSLAEAEQITAADLSSGRVSARSRFAAGSCPAKRTTTWGWAEPSVTPAAAFGAKTARHLHPNGLDAGRFRISGLRNVENLARPWPAELLAGPCGVQDESVEG